ncbi:unnamed protein product [Tuber melanosporum]|uniref:(Perigord truffle) hypothetical protein n=1 Tax=Tuber melanosporum (strain Mel28) TaxID=656061 RepID=D5GC08_TUBMM|nr:uncharacterized protein GSTUM_00005751001 [Tuber melanosporum]CAZ82051.1 unnamed protein product [Tuber melanosporum]
MPIASGSTPTCSTSTQGAEPEEPFRPGVIRSLSYRSTTRSPRGPFPPGAASTVGGGGAGAADSQATITLANVHAVSTGGSGSQHASSTNPSPVPSLSSAGSVGVPVATPGLGVNAGTSMSLSSSPSFNTGRHTTLVPGDEEPRTQPGDHADHHSHHCHHSHLHPHHHSHHHHCHDTKSSLHNTTASSFSWSTSNHEPDPHYERLVFDYRVIAQSMHAYRHISIFRRFGRLSMANLLYYQHELTEIEHALGGVDREETRWMHTGSESENVGIELKETRFKLMRRLRETLKNYYEALLLQEQIFTSLDPPRAADSNLLSALEDPSTPPLTLVDPFGKNTDDLVALGLGGRDSLEKLVGRIIPQIFPHRNPSVEDVRERNMSQRDIASIFSPFTRRITRMVIALATALLMLGPMIILQFLTSDPWKLVCISVFTIALAVLVALGTRGRGEAIVMVIAAYSAVLVVFVQGNGGCGEGGSCGGRGAA